jgi:hypothetical protein
MGEILVETSSPDRAILLRYHVSRAYTLAATCTNLAVIGKYYTLITAMVLGFLLL